MWNFKTKWTEASHWWCLHRNEVAQKSLTWHSQKVAGVVWLRQADNSNLLQTSPIPMCCSTSKTLQLQSFQMRKTSANTDGSSSSIKLILIPAVAGLREKHVKSIIWRKDFKILVEKWNKNQHGYILTFYMQHKGGVNHSNRRAFNLNIEGEKNPRLLVTSKYRMRLCYKPHWDFI